MDKHTHQFIRVSDTSKQASGNRSVYGAIVVCALCGNKRKVYEDGEIIVVYPEK